MKKIGRIVICYPKKYGINDCHKENGKDYIFNEKALCNAFSSDVEKALAAGMNGHIAKPIDINILYKTIDSAIGGKKNE